MSEALDQTRGDTLPLINDAQSTSLSCNEVSALCMKAARGAGMSWGLAEEAGFAAAWLVQRGFDGPEHLYRHLAQAQGRSWQDLCPTVKSGDWQAPAGRAICPIALGATLCDYAALPEGVGVGCEIKIGPVDYPVLLLPFLVTCAETASLQLTLSWDGGSACLGRDRTALVDAFKALDGRQASLTLTAQFGTVAPAITSAAPQTDSDTITALNAMAMRTTVPASEASRAGAGSTTTDND
jgi:hypothetical protein